MKNFKRLVGLLLCLSMVLSFVPATTVGAAESTGTSTQNTTTSDILEKIDLSGTVVGTCSSPYNSSKSYKDQDWYSTQLPGWKSLEKFVNGNTSDEITYKVSSNERGDVYLDLTKKNAAGISADQFKLYYGASGSNTTMPAVTVVLELANGSEVEETFTTNWSGTDAEDPIEWDFGQTYVIKGIYIYSSTPGGQEKQVSFAEIELYHYIEVPYLETATLNGVDLGQYKIVYSDDEPDYNYTAAKYIKEQILMRTGRSVEIVTDSAAETNYEILVGETNRSLSASTSAPGNHEMKFTINASGTKIALEADYFIIAGAAYYFVDTYIGTENFENTVSAGSRELTPITKKAKNYIFLIGDGMGVMQTRLWEKHGPSPKAEDDATYGYSDGENIFYGEYLPYKGFSKTANVEGTITDSAAGGTALSTGYKTINGYVGRDQYENDIKNLSEIAWDMGKAVGIMSTEGSDGATPASFSAHTSGRYDNEVVSDQDVLEAQGYVFVERYRSTADAYNAVFKTYTAEEFGRWDAKVKAGMSKLVNDPDGFFVMYEEAYIDKLCHALHEEGNPNATTTEDIFRAMYRFNQHIAYFMEFAMYNPDTFILITADHETGGLNENWEPTQFNVAPETGNDHSLQDVPVYVYGQGGEVFHGVTAENTSIGRTFAHIMTNGNANDFGDPQYPILLGSSSGEDVQLPAPEGLKATATTDTSITVTANGVYGGTLKFRINGGEWQSSGIFTGLTASTTYTIEAMHDASAGYIDSDIATITVTTAEPAVKVELEPVPTNKLTNAMFGYYGQNISGDITTHLYSDAYPANKAIDGTDSETRSGSYNYSDLSGTLENQQKVPVIYIELTEATVLGGVEIQGWEYDRYNMENFVVQITTEENNDNWKTVATVTQAFTEGDRGTACPPLTVEFNKTYTAYKVRILVDSISDMSSEAQGDDAGLAQYGYIRVKEVTPLCDPSATPGQAPGDPTEPTTPPTTAPTEAPTTAPTEKPTEAPTTPVVNPGDPNEQGTVLKIVPATKITPQFGVYTDANLTAFVGGNDAYCLTDGWFNRHADSQKKTTDGTIAAILTLDNTTTLGGIEIVGKAAAGNDMTSFRVQVKTANGWENVVTATSNPFDSGNRTIKYEFATPVATDEVRIIVDSCENTECKIGEIVLYEATTGKAYELIDLTGKGSSTDADAANPVKNLGDTDKTTIFLGSNATFDLTVDGQPTAVDGFNLFAYRGDRAHPTSVQVFVQQVEDGEYVNIGTFDTGWSNTYPLDSLTATFDQTYYAYNIRFEFDGWDYVNGLELYGYVQGEGGEEPEDPTDPTDPTNPTEPDVLPDIVLKPVTNAPTPIVGYYSDNNTDGVPTEYLNEDTEKGKVPAVLVDGKTGSSADYNWTGYYRYDDVASGAKIPAYYFEFDEPTAFTGVKIDGYKAMYYGMEDFTVQVYIEGKGWVTATTVADAFGAQTQEEYADPVTYPFAEPLYGTKIRILVDKIWNMYDWRHDDENSFNLEYEASIRLREITLMEDPDYVPPEDAANTLMPPSSLEVEFTDTTITVVAPPSTQYAEAEIRYAVYLNGALVEANSTGIFTGLQPNTRYTIYAKYIGDGDEWLDSHPISNTTATDKLKLPAPNVEVTLGTTTITATADEVEGGTLQFRLLNANHVAIGEWQASGVFTGLTPNTTYYIEARYNGDTDHYDSEVRTLEVETGKTLLNKPTLTVSETTHNSITLNALAAVTGGAAEYSYSVDGTNWITATGTVITGLEPETTYYLRARYVATDDSYNTSWYSEVVSATTKKAPLPAPNMSFSDITDSGFTVTADANENGTLMFRLPGGQWQESGKFAGLNRNTTYTVEAMYVGKPGYTDSEVAIATVTTLKTQLNNPTGFTETNVTTNSFIVKADAITGGTLKFRLAGGEWQTSGTFTGLTHGTTYTVEAMYVAADGYIDSNTTTIQVKTLTILDAPELTVTTVTDTSITVTAPVVTGGTLKFRINNGTWQTSGEFTGLDSNTTYTIEAKYFADEGYVDSTISSKSVLTAKPTIPTDGQYAYLEAIPESSITPHVGYNNYPNHEMYEENTINGHCINDAMYGTSAQIKGNNVTFTREDLTGYKRLSVVFDLNNGETKIGAVELTGKKGFNITKFLVQVKNTSGVWQTVKIITSNPFAENGGTGNETVMFTFNPVVGTKVRIMIEDYEENANNAPEICEMVVYEVKEDAQLSELTASSATAVVNGNVVEVNAVIDGNKTTTYTGDSVTFTFANAVNLKRLKLFGNTEGDSIGAFTIDVLVDGQWKNGVYTGNAYGMTRAYSTCLAVLDQYYTVDAVRINVTGGNATIPEIELYGYLKVPAPQDPTAATVAGATAPTKPTKPAVVSPVQTQPAATEEFVIPNEPVDMTEPTVAAPSINDESGNDPTVPTLVVPDESATDPVAPTAPVVTQKPTEAPVIGKLDLSESDVYTLSTDFNPSLDYANQNWAHTDFTEYVDGDTETWDYWTVWGERADCYVDIGATVSATQLNLYYIGYLSSSDPDNKYSYMPTVTITLVLTNGTVTETFDTGWKKATADSLTWTFGQTYEIKGIYIWSEETPIYQNKSFSLAEIELYGYVGGGSISDTYTPGTPGMDKIDLTGRVTGACSENNPSTTNTNLSNMDWYSTQKPSWDKPWKTATVDNNSSTELHFGAGGTGERADYYLDLTNGAGGYTAVEQIKMYHSGYAAVTAVTFILVLENDSEVKKEFTGLNWKTSKDVDPIVWDFGETYKVKGVYVWEPNNTTAAFGEIELYQKKTVELDPPTVDWTSVNDTSITVKAAKIDASIGTLKFRLLDEAGTVVENWQTSTDGTYTFKNLLGGKTYKAEAMYDATGEGYIDSGVGSSEPITTEETPVTSFTVTGTTTKGATVQLFKDQKLVSGMEVVATNGSYTFENIAIGVYTVVITMDGYYPETKEIVADQNVTVADLTLEKAAYAVSGTTTAGATVQLFKDQKLVDGMTTVAADGNYTFNDVAIGAYTVVVTLNGYYGKTQEIVVSAVTTVPAIMLEKAVYTVSGTVTGSTEDAVTVELYQDRVLKYTATVTPNGNNADYIFSNVEIGNYTLVIHKAEHIPQGITITVSTADVAQNVTLEKVVVSSTQVKEDLTAQTYYNVRLVEPWKLRFNVTLFDKNDLNTAIDLTGVKFGAYAVLAGECKDGKPASYAELIKIDNAVQFKKAGGQGDYNIFLQDDGKTLTFDYFDMLYTYRLNEEIYWVVYYEDAEGTIHFTDVKTKKPMDVVVNVAGKETTKNTEKVVLNSMKGLHYALLDFRGIDANLGKEYTNDDGVLNYGLELEKGTTGSYKFGKSHRIRFIEPWGLMVSYQVKPTSGAVFTSADFDDETKVKNYGMIFYYDKTRAYNGDMTAEQILALNDVYVHSKELGNVIVEEGKMVAIYTDGIITSNLNSDVFCLPFVVDADGNYHYAKNANCINLINEMYVFFNRTNLKNEERITFRKMIELYESTIVHFGKKYTKD